MGPSSRRNTILAGAFVVASLLLGVWVSFMLTEDRGGTATREVLVRFSLSLGTHGLQSGSPVLMGGQQVGVVRGWRFDLAPDSRGNQVATGVIVRAGVDSTLTLYEDAVVHLERPLLGTLSSLNIVSPGGEASGEASGGASGGASGEAGGGTASADVAPPRLLVEGVLLKGTLAPPALLAQAGYGEEQAEQVRTLIKDLSEMVATARPNVEGSAADARQVLERLRASVADWSTRVDQTLANAQAASERLDPIMTTVEAGLADFAATSASVKAAAEDARLAISEGRPRVESILKNLDEASTKINTDTIAMVNSALSDARDALGVMTEAVDGVQRLITSETPTARRILANMRLMSDQLKLTAVEVRSQPWRLLYQPTRKESDEQILYDAVRSYAEASSDLRAASESLRATTAARAASTPAEVERASAALAAALQRYTQAERAFLERLLEGERGAGARPTSSPRDRAPAAAVPDARSGGPGGDED